MMPHDPLQPRIVFLGRWTLVAIFLAGIATGTLCTADGGAADQPARLPDAVVDRPYAVSLPLASSEGQVCCTLREGTLPAGLKLAGAWLRGTPKEPGTFSLQIQAQDDVGQEATSRFQLEVLLPPAKSLTITRDLPWLIACREYRAELACEGGYPPYSWRISSGTLPKGLRLDGNTLAGTVAQAVSKPYTVPLVLDVQDARAQSASKALILQVHPNPEILLEFPGATDGGEGLKLPDAVQHRPYATTLPVRGGYGRLRWELTGRLPEGLKFVAGLLQGTPERSGTSTFSVNVTDELGQRMSRACQLDVLPPSPGPVKITTTSLPPAVLGELYRISFEAEGGLHPYRWTVQNLPRWAGQESQQLLGTPASVTDLGTAQLNVSVEDAAGGTSGPVQLPLEVTPNPRFPPPELSTAELPPAIFDQPYEVMIPATGGCPPLQFEFAAELPPGISSPKNGALRGQPTSVGVWRIPLTVTDRLGQTTPPDQKLELTLRVTDPPPPALEILTKSLPDAVLGEPYNFPLRSHGGWPPYTWRLSGDLPPWARLEEGVISGVPLHVSLLGTHTISVVVQDSHGRTTALTSLPLKVNRNPTLSTPRIATDRFPTALLGEDYHAAVVIEGGRPPYSVSAIDERLPEGIVLRQEGHLVGRIMERGDWPIDLQATDSLGQSSEVQTAVLAAREVAAASLQLGTFSELTAVVNQTFDFSFPVSGGLLPYTFSLDGQLPDGLQFDERQGRLAGTPQQAGRWSFEVRVDEGAPKPSRATGALSLTVLPTGPSYSFAWSGWVLALVLASLAIAGMGAAVLRRKKGNPSDPPLQDP